MLRGILLRLSAAFIAVIALLLPRPACAGIPFFVYGATFFYERIPASQWAPALAKYRQLGVNTIDLYVMWNWHELRDGDFDFTGRTNPRRNLVGLLRTIHADGFHVVLRPGPVIRNEWRNGGYPAWLLERPEYRMPLRDVLEGRYPATATLQNAHSDTAAREWLNNPVHLRYAARWLHEVLRVAAPWKNDILAIALDDDQGAYLDNDTWPGPNFHRYMNFLANAVRHDIGPAIPMFINTYQMKVTASAPVWAWGNWYQSDAYSIGEHDRSQLEFTAGLLQTQSPRRPIMFSEFQAGWLQGADQTFPPPADPTNTTLALHTLLQMGAHGVVNFPVQDTLNPAGWEAPWTNAFYAWDAAYSNQLTPQARFEPTARFGRLVQAYGDRIVQTHPIADAAVAYLTSAYDASRITNDQIAAIANATISAQRGCRLMRITCALVDLRYSSPRDLAAYRTIIVPSANVPLPYIPSVVRNLQRYRTGGGTVVTSARDARVAHPAAGGIPNAVLLLDTDRRFGFLDIVNYGRLPLRTPAARVGAGGFTDTVPAQTVPTRDALLIPLNVQLQQVPALPAAAMTTTHGEHLPLRPGSWVSANLRSVPNNGAIAYMQDVYQDGYPAAVLENSAVRLIVSPCAGARAFIFEDKSTKRNLFTTIGGLRDAWSLPLPPSNRDYIAKYTHPIATGTFNRCYASQIANNHGTAQAYFQYTVPELPGAHFSRSILMKPGESGFVEQTLGTGPGGAQQLTSFAIDSSTNIISVPNGVGFYEPKVGIVTMESWDRSLKVQYGVERHANDALLTLTLPRDVCRIAYSFDWATSLSSAQAVVRAFANRRPSTP